METNIKVIGFSNKRINGKSLDNKGFDLDYDGNYLDVNAFDNDRQYYTRLDNEDIMHLLNTPSSRMPLEQRIMQLNVSRYNKPLLMDNEIHPISSYDIPMSSMLMSSNHNQEHKPNQIIMYYRPKQKKIREALTRHKPKRLILQPKRNTRKITYARVSSIKPHSNFTSKSNSRYSYKKSFKMTPRTPKTSRRSITSRTSKSKPISSIRQTIY